MVYSINPHPSSSEGEDQDIEQEEGKTCGPNDESGTEWVFQGHMYLRTSATLFDPAPPQSSSIDNFPATFQEIYFKNRPVHIDCLQIFHDPDDLKFI